MAHVQVTVVVPTSRSLYALEDSIIRDRVVADFSRVELHAKTRNGLKGRALLCGVSYQWSRALALICLVHSNNFVLG